jgi:dienelactone hydrolase
MDTARRCPGQCDYVLVCFDLDVFSAWTYAGAPPTVAPLPLECHESVPYSMSNSELTIEISPIDGLVDEPLNVRLHGLTPSEQVAIHARADFRQAGIWSTGVVYRVGDDANLDLNLQRPVSGQFTEADACALIWSLCPEDPHTNPRALTEGLEDYILEVRAENAGGTVIRAVTRRSIAEGVQVVQVREPRLQANLFLPSGEGPFPTVLVLGGSGGGFPDRGAALFASHGIAAVSLAYFGVEGLPTELRRIPLEYFEGAIDWIARQAMLDVSRLAVCGTSRGGELALLLATRHRHIRCVVAYVPSSHLWGAVSLSDDTFDEEHLAAWIEGGRGLPYAGRVRNDAVRPDEHGVIRLTPAFLTFLEDDKRAEASMIPVERINGPILLISGMDDALWPSTHFGTLVEERARAHGFDFSVEHLAYAEAGHAIGAGYAPTSVTQSYHPVRKAMIDLGGTPVGLAQARADSWPRVLDFVRTHTFTNSTREPSAVS